MPPEGFYERMKAKEAEQLAQLQKAIDKWQEGLNRYCFEIKYGKIHLN